MPKKLKPLRLVEYSDILNCFSVESHDKLNTMAKDAEAMVLFEGYVNGKPVRTVVAVGESREHKSIGELTGAWIGEGPTMQRAVSFCRLQLTTPTATWTPLES